MIFRKSKLKVPSFPVLSDEGVSLKVVTYPHWVRREGLHTTRIWGRFPRYCNTMVLVPHLGSYNSCVLQYRNPRNLSGTCRVSVSIKSNKNWDFGRCIGNGIGGLWKQSNIHCCVRCTGNYVFFIMIYHSNLECLFGLCEVHFWQTCPLLVLSTVPRYCAPLGSSLRLRQSSLPETVTLLVSGTKSGY